MTNTERPMVDIHDLDKAAVLAALYNRAEPRGRGFLHYSPDAMTIEQARDILNVKVAGRFDYLQGRCLKVDLDEDTFDPYLYDREYGQGEAQSVVTSLREQGNAQDSEMQKKRREGVERTAQEALDAAEISDGFEIHNGILTYTTGLSDVKDEIQEAIHRVHEADKE